MLVKLDWSKLRDTVQSDSLAQALWYMTNQDDTPGRYPVPALNYGWLISWDANTNERQALFAHGTRGNGLYFITTDIELEDNTDD